MGCILGLIVDRFLVEIGQASEFDQHHNVIEFDWPENPFQKIEAGPRASLDYNRPPIGSSSSVRMEGG